MTKNRTARSEISVDEQAEKAIMTQVELRRKGANVRIDNWFFLLAALPRSEARLVAAVCQGMMSQQLLDVFDQKSVHQSGVQRRNIMRDRILAARHKLVLVGAATSMWRWCALEYVALIDDHLFRVLPHQLPAPTVRASGAARG